MRYYSKARPITPGAAPKDGLLEVVNYDEPVLVPDINVNVWGYAEYGRELTAAEIDAYELIPADQKTWYAVTTMFYDDGRVKAGITKEIRSVSQPESTFRNTRRSDVYTDWFDSIEKANDFIRDAVNA